MDEIELEQLIEKCSEALGKDVRYENIKYTVRDLLNIIDRQQNEYITLSRSIAEDDSIIQLLQEEVEQKQKEIGQYQLQETLLLERLKKIEKNTRYLKFMKMAEENLSLAQEVALLKGEISG